MDTDIAHACAQQVIDGMWYGCDFAEEHPRTIRVKWEI